MSDFASFVVELLQPWRAVSVKRMFGGHGVYHGGLMFALVAQGQLYLKVDDESRLFFEAAGLRPFLYEAKGRKVALSYWLAPEAMMDEPELAREWAERGWQAALRAQMRRPSKAPARPARPPKDASKPGKA